ncbi:hypothetical protein H4S08_001183 [Coemansia sp. RSA 1365]|nr:hypothetical protein H4S08_001183 [Coemansia sp. RSA 1365]
MPEPNLPPDAHKETELSEETHDDHRRSTRQHRPRYLDNALTGNEVFELLDEYIIDSDGGSKPRRRKRQKKLPATPSNETKSTTLSTKCTPAAKLRPRWYNQMYLMFLALRQSPDYTASRSELVRKAVELDAKISKERSLPRAFTGKTPMNSASALLTNNGDRHFVQFRPPGARCYHFKLAYKPGDFEGALLAYNEWMKVLVEKDWPVCFGPEPSPADCLQLPPQNLSAGDFLGTLQTPDTAAIQPNKENAEAPHQPLVICADESRPHCAKVNDNICIVHKDDTVEKSDDPGEIDIPKNWNDIVEVRSSTIPNAGNGLFAVRDLPGGIPIGFYFGVPMTEDEFDSLKEPVGLSSHYSIMYRKTVLDATDENGMPFTDPNGPLYCPFHFMNEARGSDTDDDTHRRCNITFLEGVVVNQIICLTTRLIKKGEELFASYGSEVDRSHWDDSETRRSKSETQDMDQTDPGGSVLGLSNECSDQSHEFAAPRTLAMRAAASADIECRSVSNTTQATQNQSIVRILKTLATSDSTGE